MGRDTSPSRRLTRGRLPAALLALWAIGGCGDGGGRSDISAPPSGTDAGPDAESLAPVEDAFVLADARPVRDASPVVPSDAAATGLDAARAVDAAVPVADAGGAPAPPGAGLAAGAAPLRSARYRLFAIVGPAAAVGAPMTSPQYRLESGPTLWLAPASEPSP